MQVKPSAQQFLLLKSFDVVILMREDKLVEVKLLITEEFASVTEDLDFREDQSFNFP